jgi:hypothetical protein
MATMTLLYRSDVDARDLMSWDYCHVRPMFKADMEKLQELVKGIGLSCISRDKTFEEIKRISKGYCFVAEISSHKESFTSEEMIKLDEFAKKLNFIRFI